MLSFFPIGTITFAVRFRHFNYKDWYSNWEGEESNTLDGIKVDRNRISVDNIYSDPEVMFKTHNRDTNTNWDEWWLRHKEFSRTSR